MVFVENRIRTVYGAAVLCAVLAGGLLSAAEFADAVAWWKLGPAAAGPVEAGQVLDAQADPAHGTVVAGNPQWVAIPGAAPPRQAVRLEQAAVGFIRDALPDKLGCSGALTLFVCLRVGDSERQQYGPNNWILTRKKGGSGVTAGQSWGLRYAKWGAFHFDLYAGGTVHSVQGSPGHYKQIENKWLNIFAVFKPGEEISLSFYDGEDGRYLGSSREAVDFQQFDHSPTQRHTCLGGVFESDERLPLGTFVGEIAAAAVWNQALTRADMDRLAMVPAGNKREIRYSDPRVFDLNLAASPTPHIPWATPLAGGPLKALALGTLPNGREIVELWQRLDMDLAYVTALNRDELGTPRNTHRQYLQVEGWYDTDFLDRLDQALQQESEVILLGNVEWTVLPKEVREKIMGKVEAGAGLVVAYPPQKPDETWGKLTADVKPTTDYLAVLPYDWLPAFSEGGKQPREALAQLKGGSYGRGRVAVLDWEKGRDEGQSAHAFTRVPLWSPLTRYGWHYDLEMALVAKAILWAARRTLPAEIRAVRLDRPSVPALEPVQATVEIEAAEDFQGSLEVCVRDLHNAVRERRQLTLAVGPGRQEARLAIPVPEAGIYSLDCVVRQDGKACGFAAAVVEVVSPCRVKAMTLDRKMYVPGQSVRAVVDIEGQSAGAALEVRLSDRHGRLTAVQRRDLPGAGRYEVELQPLPGMTTGNLAEARVLLGERLLDRHTADYVLDRRAVPADRYHVTVWGELPADYLTALSQPALKEAGVDSLYIPHFFVRDPEYLRTGIGKTLENGLDVAAYIWREFAYAKRDLRDLVREPCLTSPSHQFYMNERLGSYAELAAAYAPVFCSLGDESYLLHFWEGVNGRDVCFSPTCLASLREYLRATYPTLEALNAQWGTSFTAWDEVRPDIFEEATARGNLSAWVDHRRHMSGVFNDALGRARQIIAAADPHTRIGPEGMYPWDAFKGYDWYRLGQENSYLGPYGYLFGYTLENDRLLAFTPAGKDAMRLVIAGWYPDVSVRHERYSRNEPWMSMLHGYGGILYFNVDPGSSTMSGVTPDLGLTDYLEQTLAEAREIRRGPFQLIAGSQRQNQAIALYYSDSANLAGSTLSDPMYRSVVEDEAQAWAQFLYDAALDHTHVAAPEVLAHGLAGRDRLRVLILPLTLTLADREADAIRGFVERGGVLVADALPGVLDEHGKERPAGVLDEVFGVQSRGTVLTRVEAEVQPGDQGRLKVERVATLALAGARSLATVDGTPLFMVHEVGRGKALLANTTMTAYPELKKQGLNLPAKSALLAWLQEAGVQPQVAVSRGDGSPLPGLEVLRFVDGESQYIGVVKNAARTPAGEEEFVIRLPETRHLYDVRAGRYLGETGAIAATVSGANTRLFALLSYQVTAVSLGRLPAAIVAGQTVSASLGVEVSHGRPGRHALRLEFANAAGPLDYYTRVVELAGGKGRFELHTALNEQPGAWTIKATDVASGVSREWRLTVK